MRKLQCILAAMTLGWCLTALAAVEEAPGVPLRSLEPPVKLPDGREFKTWETPLQFTRTWHVDGSHPAASDQNPGSADRPFRTIGRAAEVAEPGHRILIASGIYREHVRPRRGGTGPTAMISYEAAPGATVILKGSMILQEPWKRLDGSTWSAALPPRAFDGYNPFDTDNVTAEQFEIMRSWAWDLRGKLPYTLPRGLVFQDGRRMAQVAARDQLASAPGTYWVDRPAQVLYIRPFGDADPRNATIEFTNRRVAFGPDQVGLGFIRVKGLIVEQVGNAFPMQQEGAISTWSGHHWIIEENTVRQVNGVGIDVGVQYPRRPRQLPIGHHVVRRNTLEDIGVCGIAGLGSGDDFGLLIEDNVIRRAAWHPVERLYETGGIKTHLNTNCLIRHNWIADTLHGSAIWMDYMNVNSRCCQNILLNSRTQYHGAFFIEASSRPNLIDRNIIWNTQGNGIYEHDGANQIFAHNLIGHSTGAAIVLRGKVTDRRPHNEPIVGGSHRVLNNLFIGNARRVEQNPRNPPSALEGNLSEGISARFDPDAGQFTWSIAGPLPAPRPIDAVTHDFINQPAGAAGLPPGPFLQIPRQPATLPLRPATRPATSR